MAHGKEKHTNKKQKLTFGMSVTRIEGAKRRKATQYEQNVSSSTPLVMSTLVPA